MRCHQMCRPEPNRERQLGPMHHSPGCHGGLLAAGNTLMGIGAAPQQVTPLPTAPRTNDATRRAALKQELGAVRFVRKPLLKCEERVRNGHRRRSCSVGGSESSETWDNGISLPTAVLIFGFEAIFGWRDGASVGLKGEVYRAGSI